MMSRLIIISFFAIISISPAFCQTGDWAIDSLNIYESRIQQALEKDQLDEVRDLYDVIFNKGENSLNPLIIDQLYRDTEKTIITAQPEILASLFHHIGNIEFYRSDITKAREGFERAMQLYEKASMERQAAGMGMNLGVIMERASEYDAAISNYNKSIALFKSLNDTSSVANCLENIALAYNHKGEFDLALTYINQADSVLQTNTASNTIRWAGLYYNKSLVLASKNEYDQSLTYALKGLRISQEIGNERQTNTGYHMIINTYQKIDDRENWLKYLNLSMAFSKKIGNFGRIADLNFDLAHFMIEENKLDSAVALAETNLKYYEDNAYDGGLLSTYLLLGNIEYQRPDYNKAVDYYNQAMNNIPKSGSKHLAGLYHNIGASYHELKNNDNAERYLLMALDERLKMNDILGLSETYEVLSNTYRDKEDFNSAYKNHVKYKQYEDSVFNEIKSKQIAKIQTEFETEQKDLAIASLQQQNEIQKLTTIRQKSQIYLALAGLAIAFIIAFILYKRARLKQKVSQVLTAKNLEIEKKNSEKEVLLKEIHHRVKNNLQVISSLLTMQTRYVNDSNVVDAMKESQSRVKSMALIHEKLYQSEGLSHINMNHYIIQLSEFLAHTYSNDKAIDIVIEGDEVHLDIDTAVPLGLITNELISNALKYAFVGKEQGQVTVQLYQIEDNNYQMVIRDSGVGITGDLENIGANSLGFRLVKTLTRQLEGNLAVTVKEGSIFTINFKGRNIAA